jgi:UDP-glucose:(heptosyl)LPS alpha-1,3-glucosyltransferase
MVLMLSDRQRGEYAKAWQADPERLAVLPPTISRTRRHPELRTTGARAVLRERLGFAPDDWVWLAIGVQPHTKGLDRTVRAMRDFPAARLLVSGLADSSARALAIVAGAKACDVADRITWAGHREDVPELMAAADLLVHPARRDTTGAVILESLVNGLPVITTSACGYARHVEAADAGIVIGEPFAPAAFSAALATSRDPGRRARWSAAGAHYGLQSYLYDGHVRATELILSAAAERARGRRHDDQRTAEVMHLHDARRLRAGEH